MKISIDTTQRKIWTDESNYIPYYPGSAMDNAIRVVEKLLKIHIRSQKQGSIITSRTR